MLNIFSNKKTSKGFTLIELLVVVAIISLLTSVVLTSIKESREKAEINSFISQLKQLQNALELYRNDYGEYPQNSSSETIKSLIDNKLNPYIKSFNLPSFIPENAINYTTLNFSITRGTCNFANTLPKSRTYYIRISKSEINNVILPLPTETRNGLPVSNYCLTFE